MTNSVAVYDPFATHTPRPRRSSENGADVILVARFSTDPGRATELAAQLAESLRRVAGLSTLDIDIPARPALHLVQPSFPRDRPLRIDVPSRTVWLRGSELRLTRREFDLLLELARHPHEVFTRPMLLTAVWGISDHGRSRTVDVHIRRLRAVLGPDLPLSTTVRGVGYRLDHADDLSIEE